MVSKQILASGGSWLNFGGTEILLDPGPGCLVHAVKRKLDPTRLAAIVLSHKHLDHSGDINVMIEAMTDGGRRERGRGFAPSDALNSESDPVVLRYLRSFPEAIEVLVEGGKYRVGDVEFATPVRHHHGVETYGFVFQTPRHTLSWITDTRFFPELTHHYHGEFLVINVVRYQAGSPFDHLSVPEVKHIIQEVRPRAAIITHFGMTMWQARPWEVAKQLTEETGIRVVSARDGLSFDLAQRNDGGGK
ncbi:MAG: MBL fold metallo-hydrolase [Dehalococcoidia bacterium]|nr:MBL fold metallo-hydrolase [Dehalococcoidia bacterium]